MKCHVRIPRVPNISNLKVTGEFARLLTFGIRYPVIENKKICVYDGIFYFFEIYYNLCFWARLGCENVQGWPTEVALVGWLRS